MDDLPAVAAWRHVEAREGFEVLFVRRDGRGVELQGHTSAVEEGEAWAVGYELALDASWATRRARVTSRSATGLHEVVLELTDGRWRIDGRDAPELDGCLDVDLEASACTNAMPVRRLALDVGESADAPAVYVRATDVRVERLEQRYTRLPDLDGRLRFDYDAPRFGYHDVLVYDASASCSTTRTSQSASPR